MKLSKSACEQVNVVCSPALSHSLLIPSPKPLDYLLWLVRKRRRLQIDGASMVPTLLDGQEILVDLGAYSSVAPEVDDVVLVRHPFYKERTMVKRVTKIWTNPTEKRFHIEGDNKTQSTDSRSFGSVTRQKILGKVTSRF